MAVNPPQESARERRSASRARAYHHGDLRQALLEAAQSILEERGLEGFTLRECARRAGVSHAAPAHHFGDAAGLLTAFATAGFHQLSLLMQSYREAAQGEPRAQLRAVGRAYIDFAISHRAQFQLMFRDDRLVPGDAGLREAGREAAGHLADTLAAALAARGVKEAGPDFERRLVLGWSAVHGFATLLLEGRLDGSRGARPVPSCGPDEADAILAILEVALLAPVAATGNGTRDGTA